MIDFFCASRHFQQYFSYFMASQSFDYENTWRKLYQKRGMSTKLDIYVSSTDIITHRVLSFEFNKVANEDIVGSIN